MSFYFITFKYIFIYLLVAIHYSLPSNGDLNRCLKILGIGKHVKDYTGITKICYWLYPDFAIRDRIFCKMTEIENQIELAKNEDEKKELNIQMNQLIGELYG